MSLQSYVFTNININDAKDLERFLINSLPRVTRYNSLIYNPTTKVLTIYTKESIKSNTTETLFSSLVNTKYPNPPVSDDLDPADIASYAVTGNVTTSTSVYGYFPTTTSVDGDVVISKNLSLTRNMYYSNLTINTGVTLNVNGWRLVVTDTLVNNGIISNDGSDASSNIAGTGTSNMYTTYLGPGTAGGAGLTASGYGNAGVSAAYQCAGAKGGDGGQATGLYSGGSAGAFVAVSPVDGGLNALSTLPIAFLGRMLSSNFYILGGTGGGGGAGSRGTSSTIKSGGGGGGGGFMVVAARNISGTGKFSAHGGNGSSGTVATGSGCVGGGGGGGGGCIIVISQSEIPATITMDVLGGTGGASAGGGGAAGKDGSAGNIFKIQV